MYVETTTIAEIEEEKVEFLTYPYIPLGKLSLINGDPNTGKTHLALAIAAAVTTGKPLPWDTERSKSEPASVIFQSMDDGYGDTIKPRLMRLGADCNRIHIINEEKYPLSLDDSRVEQAIEKSGAKMVIFDPLTAYCNGYEMSNSGGIRPVLTQLADVAHRTNCAAVAICHLNKKGGKSQYRTLGSIDVAAIARSVITVGKMPGDEEISLFVHGKSNLSKPGKSQAFAFDGDSGVVWLGEFPITLDELLKGKLDPNNQERQQSQLDKAKDFISSAMSSGVTAAAEIKNLASSAGISKNTLERAKTALGVSSVKKGESWQWKIPEAEHTQHTQDTQKPVCAENGYLGVLDPKPMIETDEHLDTVPDKSLETKGVQQVQPAEIAVDNEDTQVTQDNLPPWVEACMYQEERRNNNNRRRRHNRQWQDKKRTASIS